MMESNQMLTVIFYLVVLFGVKLAKINIQDEHRQISYLIMFFLVLVLQFLQLGLISAVLCQYIHNLCLVFS